MTDTVNPSPLEYGKLAPSFELLSTDGQTYTRGQFRNRSGLVLVFFQPSTEAINLLKAISGDEKEYRELNSRVLAVGRAPVDVLEDVEQKLELPFTVLSDPDGTTWKSYSGYETAGYGVVILDMYGGVDAQKLSTSFADLPHHDTILDWARAAQYKCSI